MGRSLMIGGAKPVVYAGRFADRVSSAELPDGYRILSDWDVLPWQLAAAVRGTPALVIVDLFSFPYEAMTEDQWDVPLLVVLPYGFDAAYLSTVFGKPVFERLGFFDRVVTPDDGVWEELRRRYSWAECQRARVGTDDGPVEAAIEVCSLLETGSSEPVLYEPRRYGSEHPGLTKAVHRTQAVALEERFAAARDNRDEEVPFDVLEIGVGVGRWASSFDLARTNFFGVDVSEEMLAAARANYPMARFDYLEPNLLLPYDDETFDLVFTVDVLHHNPRSAKRTLLSEMWRVTRPGGRLMFLEDFVAERLTESSTVYPMSVLGFVELMIEATFGQVTLEHVQSLRYPGDDFVRAGLISLCKLGVPGRW